MSFSNSPLSPVALSKASATTRGIILIILAVMGFSALDATAKNLVQNYPTLQVVWMRFVGQVILVSLILGPKLPQTLRTRYPYFHLTRAFCQMGATITFFLALSHIGLAEATALGDLSPVLITLGAALFLGEKLGLRRVVGVTAALIGALIVIRPGTDVFTMAALLPLCTAVFFAASALLARHLRSTESHWTAMILSGVIGCVVLGLIQPTIWQPIAWSDLPLFALAAIFGTIGQLCLFRAYSYAEAGAIAPFSYFGLLFATIWGILFFDEWPDPPTIAGTLVIVGAGIYVWHRETRAARRSGED